MVLFGYMAESLGEGEVRHAGIIDVSDMSLGTMLLEAQEAGLLASGVHRVVSEIDRDGVMICSADTCDNPPDAL